MTDSIKDSKLIDILKGIDKQEVDRLKRFMDSPYFINKEKESEFAGIILREYPDFKGQAMDKKSIHKQLYPTLGYSGITINILMSSMVSYVYKFFVAENFFNDDIEQQLRLIEVLRGKELGREFLRMGSKLHSSLETGKKDQQYYYQLTRFSNELGIYYNQSKEHIGYSQYLQSKANALDTFYISAKLRIVCEMVNRQNIFSSKYEISSLDIILNYVESNMEKFENQASVNIYYRILLTLTDPSNEENYFKLIDLLDKAENDFSLEELKEMYTFAMNYCIKQLNGGRLDYEGHLFQLYRKLIDTGLIYDNNHISQLDYKNIIATSLRVSEFEWTETFIHSNKDKINPIFRDVAYSFNLANLYCEKKEFARALKTLHQFDDALKRISDPDFDDAFYNLDSRSIFIKIYYESNEDDLLKATIDTFKSYLLRNRKISERRRKIYLNLLKYTKKLSDQRQRLRYNSNAKVKANLRKLKAAISEEKNLVNLSWLQARVEELEKEVA